MSYAPLDDRQRSKNNEIGSYEEDQHIYRSSPTTNGLSEPLRLSDPFHVLRDDLSRKMDHVDEALAEYLRIVFHTVRPARAILPNCSFCLQDSAVNTHELKDAKKQLKRHIRIAESTLKDVVMTVQVVENDRQKFSHIDDNELYDRNTLVQTSRDRLTRTKDEMQSEAVKAKLLQDERAKAARRAGAMTIDSETTVHRAIDSQARQSLLMQHQDETLDELGEAVIKVGHMAETINEEIGQQNKMLSEMEEDLEHVEEELGMVMGKLAKVLKTKDRWQLGTIICLTFTAVILFLMVLYF